MMLLFCWLSLALAEDSPALHTRDTHLQLWTPLEKGTGPSGVGRELVLTPALVEEVIKRSRAEAVPLSGDTTLSLGEWVQEVHDGVAVGLEDEGRMAAAFVWDSAALTVNQYFGVQVVLAGEDGDASSELYARFSVRSFLGESGGGYVYGVEERLPYDDDLVVPKLFVFPTHSGGTVDSEHPGYVFAFVRGEDETVEGYVARVLVRDDGLEDERLTDLQREMHRRAGVITQTPTLGLYQRRVRHWREPVYLVVPVGLAAGVSSQGMAFRGTVDLKSRLFGGHLELSERGFIAMAGLGSIPRHHYGFMGWYTFQVGMWMPDLATGEVGGIGRAEVEFRLLMLGLSAGGAIGLLPTGLRVRADTGLHLWLWRRDELALSLDVRGRFESAPGGALPALSAVGGLRFFWGI